MRTAMRIAAMLVLAVPTTVMAVPITFEFSGHVTFTADSLGLDPDVAIGSAFSASLTFDDAVAPTTSAPDWASYQENVSAFDLTFAGVSFARAALPLGPSSPSTGGVYVANNRFPDGRDTITFASSLQHLASDPTTGSLFRYATLSGVSSNQNTFTSLSMPTSLDPAAFDYVPLTITAYYSQWNLTGDNFQFLGDGQINGVVTSLRTVDRSVPEPGTLGLMSVGLLALLARRRPRPDRPQT